MIHYLFKFSELCTKANLSGAYVIAAKRKCMEDPSFFVAGEISEEELNKVNPYVIGVSVFAIVFAGVAGSAYAIYKEVCFTILPFYPDSKQEDTKNSASK